MTEALKPREVQYFDQDKGELVHKQENKVKRFVNNKCLEYAFRSRCPECEMETIYRQFKVEKPVLMTVLICTRCFNHWEYRSTLAGEKKGVFICLNLIGYNVRIYTMDKIKMDGQQTFRCDCQAWKTKLNREEIVAGGMENCAHTKSLRLAFKNKYFINDEEER